MAFPQSHAALYILSNVPHGANCLGRFNNAHDVQRSLMNPLASAGCEPYWTHASSILSRIWQQSKNLKRRHIFSKSMRLPGDTVHTLG